jgi:hypothetical protein
VVGELISIFLTKKEKSSRTSSLLRWHPKRILWVEKFNRGGRRTMARYKNRRAGSSPVKKEREKKGNNENCEPPKRFFLFVQVWVVVVFYIILALVGFSVLVVHVLG